MNQFFLTSSTLLKRELFRFVRQKNRIVGALATPFVFWFFIGSGLNQSFNYGELNYLQYFYPGSILLILLFTAIFSTISIIDDRKEGFLQSVLVSPSPRSALVMGHLLGGTLLATFQGVIFFILAPFLGFELTLIRFIYLISILFFISFGLTGLGYLLAWRLDSTQGFHAIMNLFLMPLWLLSGALFPLSGAPSWLSKIMVANPLTYAISGLHQGFLGSYSSPYTHLSNPLLCLIVCFSFSIVMYMFCVKTISKN